MEKEVQLRIVSITFIISLVSLFILSIINVQLFTIGGIKSAFSISTILTLWWIYYFYYGWKVPKLNKILFKENINGTWFGIYESVDTKNGNRFSGEISLIIKQNFLNLHVSSCTEKYKNNSYSEMLSHDKKSDKNKLVYVYAQEEVNVLDQFIRKGTTELELTMDKNKAELFGKFWTNSGTVGQLKLKNISKDHIEFFEEAKIKAVSGGFL